jgi:hypothetical protein
MSPFHDNTGSSDAPNGQAAGPYDETSRALAGLPRPRRVRMSLRGKTTLAVTAVILLASLGIFVAGLSGQSRVSPRNSGSPQILPFAIPIVFILLFVPLMFRSIIRQKPLLVDGEIAAARVTKRWASRHGPRIQYEFNTPLGEHFSSSAVDGSGQLAVGMNVPVFYDSQTPKRQIALCASLYEVVLPGEE